MSSSRQSSPGFFYSLPALPSHPDPLIGSSQKEQKPRETEHWGSETTDVCRCTNALPVLAGSPGTAWMGGLQLLLSA